MANGPPGHPDGRYEYNADGTSRVAYDANGNRLYEESGEQVRTDYARQGGSTTRTDPMTGEAYSYDQPTTEHNSNRKIWDSMRDRRGGRQARRKQEEAEREARTNYYGGLATEQTAGIDDPWMELAGSIPSAEEYAGEHLTSELAGAQADGQSVAAQQAALQQLQQISQNGRTAAEEAQLQQARDRTAQQERSQRDAIMQQAALRGMQGAGTTLGAQLQAQQAGANRYSQAEMDAQAQAEARALQAMQMRGQLGGQMRGQSFNEDATRRSAADQFAQWNRSNDQAGKDFNFGASATAAQGLSGARATQSEQNRAMMENAQGQKTKTEKRVDQAGGLIGSI